MAAVFDEAVLEQATDRRGRLRLRRNCPEVDGKRKLRRVLFIHLGTVPLRVTVP